MTTRQLSTEEELDAELARLLLDTDADADAGGGGEESPAVDRVAQLEQRVAALERVLGDTLEAFQDLAEQRIERAAMDAAMAVRRAFATTESTSAVAARVDDSDTVITQDI